MQYGNAIYDLGLPATDARISDDIKNHHVCMALLNFFPKDIRRLLEKMRGMSNATVAEYLIAHAKGTLVVHRGVGLDFLDGSEGKFATVDKTIQKVKSGKKEYFYDRYKANVSNLTSKTGDLHIVVADTRIVGKVKIRFFSFPFEVWKDKISGDTFKMDLTQDTHKWYIDYEVTKEEFGLR